MWKQALRADRVLIIHTRGAHQRLIHFVGLCIFLCLCVPLRKTFVCSRALFTFTGTFGRTKLIPAPFLGRVHQLSHSPQTLSTQRDHSGGPLVRRSAAPPRRSDTQQPFCGNVLKSRLRVWMICILHVNPLLSPEVSPSPRSRRSVFKLIR